MKYWSNEWIIDQINEKLIEFIKNWSNSSKNIDLIHHKPVYSSKQMNQTHEKLIKFIKNWSNWTKQMNQTHEKSDQNDKKIDQIDLENDQTD